MLKSFLAKGLALISDLGFDVGQHFICVAYGKETSSVVDLLGGLAVHLKFLFFNQLSFCSFVSCISLVSYACHMAGCKFFEIDCYKK